MITKKEIELMFRNGKLLRENSKFRKHIKRLESEPMKAQKTLSYIALIPVLLGLEFCTLLMGIIDPIFRGKYILDRIAFREWTKDHARKK